MDIYINSGIYNAGEVFSRGQGMAVYSVIRPRAPAHRLVILLFRIRKVKFEPRKGMIKKQLGREIGWCFKHKGIYEANHSKLSLYH